MKLPLNLRFWNRWVKSSSDDGDLAIEELGGEYHRFFDLVLDEAVLWCTVVILIATTAGILGSQLTATQEPIPDERRIALLALLWQALLQLLVNYCTVVPVLREQRQQRKKGAYSFTQHNSNNKHDVVIRVHYAVFYGCVVASVVATVLAPMLLVAVPNNNPTASNVANFASNIFAAIAASQLAAGITSGLRRME
ncbi:hypothetical protein PG990_014904 [Apiospora arundinis]|uniref:Transmembrane protein n=1 Tax=Apiospora arundinis TaxID=335852 RepID=A0ABR2HKJ9_9PEZI